MALTNNQKRAIHCAARQAGIDPKTAEDTYRLVLWNVGGFRSAADKNARRSGYIAVMAFFEERAGGQLKGASRGYWGDQDAKANPRDAIIYKIEQEAAALGMSRRQCDGFLAGDHCSSGQYESLDDAPTRWLVKCLEGLKKIRQRRQHQTTQRV